MSKTVARNVLSPRMAAHVWTGNYAPVFPFTPQHYWVGALMPAVLYMFRWGHRRGVGQFEKKFSRGPSERPTIDSVAERLAESPQFEAFDTDAGKAILGDLLLAH